MMFDRRGKGFGKKLLAALLAAAMTVTMTETPVSAAEAEMSTTATETEVSEEGAVNPEEGTTGEPDSGNTANTSENPKENGESETPENPDGGEETGDLETSEEGSGTETPENPDDGEDTENPGNPEEGNGVQTPDTPQEPSDDIGVEEPEEKTPEEQPGEEIFDSVSENDAGAAAALLQSAELQADEDKASSGKINNISWRVESGTLTIEGTGDYIPEKPPWTGRDDVTSAVVRVTGLTSARGMFNALSKLEEIDLTGLETSQVTDMSQMFAGCASLKNLDISKFQTSNVTDMSGMFARCRLLSSLDVSGFDTKNVTNMSGMFSVGDVGQLEQGDIDYIDDGCYHSGYKNGRLRVDVSGFHTENVTDMSWMFAGCRGGVTFSPSGFHTEKVTDMNHMFYYSVVAGGNISGFDTGRVTDMSYMFMKCGVVHSLNLNLSRFDTGNVENMERMFSGFYFGLPDPDFKSFNTGKVKNMIRMFEKCGGVKKLDLSSFETSRVPDMTGMFDKCRSLETLDLSSFDTGNTDSMSSMFSGCTSLRQLDLSSFDMGMRYYTDSTIGIGELEGLEYICAPVHCNIIEKLPVSTGRWYMEDGTECSVLPVGLSESIVLYKNGYPGDGKTRQIVSVSGISVKGKEYDGNPYTYEGTAAVTNAAGEEIPGVTLSGVYSGTLTDGSVYEESETAPVRAGNYTLKFQVSGLDEKQYICRKTEYAFHIARREVTITAPSVNVPLGGPLPDLSTLTCEVSEMAGTDSLSKQPLLKYGTEEGKIVLNKAGIYDIIPYGAAIADEAAGNYSITYKNGTLKVGDASDPSDEVVDSGKINGISWSIDKKGKLTVKGTGDYAEEEEIINDVQAGEVLGVKPPWAGDARIFTAEVSVSGITDTTRMFYNCKNLKSIEMSGLNTGKVTSMYGMFQGCTALEKLDLAKFDTAKVKDMGYMFTDCRSLTKLDLRSFHTENVQVMYNMFEGCSRLANVDVSSFNTKNVGTMSSMFAGCVSLETLDISNFSMNGGGMDDMFHSCTSLKSLKMCEVRTRSIRNMFYSCTALQSLELRGSANYIDGVFKNCISLVKLDLSGFDTGEVVNMSGMFSGCSSLKNINLNGFDTGKVTDMSGMFSGCSSLKNINLSGLDTGEVTSMSEMFSGCSSLTNLNVSSLNTENVEGMWRMFRGCSSLVDLDVSGFHTEKLGNMGGMFEKCSSLTALDLSNFKTDQVENMSDMFRDCYSLASLNLNGITTENTRYMDGVFQNCSSLTDLDLSSFGEYTVDGYYDGRVVHDMFNGCTALTILNLDGFGTEQSRDMSNMFLGCESLTGLDVSSFDTAEADDMSGMFAGCSSLTTLNLNNFNTHFVRDMSSMFEGCSSLSDVEVSSFDIGFLRNMSRMFADCTALTSLDLSSFERPAVMSIARNADMTGMFSGCSSLVDLDMRNFNMDRIYDYVNDLFAGCSSLSILYTPVNCVTEVPLPSQTGDQWKSANGRTYTKLPQNSAKSILLYKNGYLDNGAGGLKEIVTVSGVSVKSRKYDGTDNPYTGAAVATDSEGNVIEDLSFTYKYSGTMADGTAYAESVKAPSQAGVYSLSVDLAGADADKYALRKNRYRFQIMQKEVMLHVSTLIMEPGTQAPSPEDIEWEAEGFMEGDGLICEPSFRYSPELATPLKTGRYQIIPFGADAGNNYRIIYKNGVLLVGGGGDVLPDDLPADGVIPEGLWIAGMSDEGYAYTGKAIKPEVRVYDYHTLLKEKTDYTISYKNNKKASNASAEKTAPTITVTGKGNYTGKETQTFRILPLDIGGTEADGSFAADDMTVAYNKRAQKPAPVLWWNDKKLKNRTDYTYTYVRDTDGERLDSVKDPGVYWIEIAGKGNFKGRRRIKLLVTDSLKLVSKLRVETVKAQTYTGNAIEPLLTVKDGKTTLTENTHYTVAYSRNTAVGTAYAVVTGIEKAGYSGTKRISFKITGIPINKATVSGLSGKEFFYGGIDITPKISLSVKVQKDGVTTTTPLAEGADYTAVWKKNREAGTASVIFTGKGAYTGTMKKTFKIKPFVLETDTGGRVMAALAQESVPYAKGGAKPAVTLTFRQDDGTSRTLKEGTDYTLAFKNHTAVNDGSNPDKLPQVTIRGKGNFRGTYSRTFTYRITQQDLGQLRAVAQDKTYQNRKNSYATKVSVIDLDGKALKAGIDYDKNFKYTYLNETVVQTAPVKNISAGGSAVRAAGAVVEMNDIIPAGTVLRVTLQARADGYYTGTLTGEYRISKSSISAVSVSIPAQTYTGQEITLEKDDITVRVKGKPIDENQERSQWEIVPGSYKNNVKKGTASVTIKGLDNYGGEKTVKFTIKAKGFTWWWK